MWQQWIITLYIIPSHLSILSHRLTELCWAPSLYTVLASHRVQYQVVSKSSASWSGPQKQLRQDLSMSPVGQRGDLSWSPRLPRSTEGSVSHHNSSHLEPVGKMPERQILTCWSARRAERQKGNLKWECGFDASPWKGVIWVASCGSEDG